MANRVRIYDNGGKTIDRYTLVIPNPDTPSMIDMYGFDENPSYPQDFEQFSGTYLAMRSYTHLGKLVPFLSLSDEAQRYVREILGEYGIPSEKIYIPKAKPRQCKPPKRGMPRVGIQGLRR